MSRKVQLEILKELLWLGIAVILCLGVTYPLFGVIDNQHLLLNIGLIVLFVYYFRFTVFLGDVRIFKNNYIKAGFFALNIGVFLFTLERLQYFFYVFDNYDNRYFASGNEIEMSQPQFFSMVEFFKKEIVFFMIGFLILIVFLQFRLLFSKWKRKKS
ncbi:MAG: hypothetical protein EA412_01355 [Chitinophagaceae bacterium]|nr:MAG: hypothetical protein EA412_01355 [Chitinophagaceae bacterium]